jgi:hypothetical protein
MKKIASLFSILILTIVSCSKNEDVTEDVTTDSKISLKKMIFDEGNGNPITYDFTYNDNKLNEISYEFNGLIRKNIYSYDGNLIMKIETFNGQELSGRNQYFYENNNLKTLLYEDIGTGDESFSVKFKYIYTHNLNGTIFEEKFKLVDGAYENLDETSLYTMINGNLTKKNMSTTYSFFNGSNTETIRSISTNSYEYDNKNNPFKNILGFNKIQFSDFYSSNNVIKETSQYESVTGDEVSTAQNPKIKNYVLIYDANNYLTESKYDFTNYDEQTRMTVTKTRSIKYFYE